METGANRLSDVCARVMPETDAPFPIFMLFKNSCVARGNSGDDAHFRCYTDAVSER